MRFGCVAFAVAWSVATSLCDVSNSSHSQSNVTVSYVWKHDTTLGYMHMSMIESLGGTKLAVAFQAAKTHEGYNDQALYLRTSNDLAQTWSSLRRVVDTPLAVWGPVLHYNTTSTQLWLFYSASGSPEHRTDRPNASYPGGSIRVTVSDDEGTTWSGDREILSWAARGQVSKVTANKLIVSDNGTWLLPFWQEAHSKADKGPSCAGVVRSLDQGATWTPTGCLTSTAAGWLIENSLAQLKDGRLLMVFRTRCGKMYKAYSSDDGLTWDTPSATELRNPNAKIALFRRNDGPGVVLAYNPSSSHRTPLSLATTEDGQTWNNFATLEDSKTNVFDYPTPTQVGGQIFTTYSANKHTAIKLAITALPCT